jgi:AraC family transcriptional activator of mtrCDE
VDALSRLLTLYPLRTALEVRCHFAAPWIIGHGVAEAGVAPYHMLVSGQAWLDAGPGEPIALQAGDVVVFPRGSAHRLRTEHAEQATPESRSGEGKALPLLTNGGSGPASEVLCGRFELEAVSGPVLLNALPALINVRTADRPDFAGLSSLIAMLRNESEALRPGASAVLAQLSSALFALVIRAWLEQAEGTPGLFALLAERRLQAVLQAMLAAPGEDWPLERMAALCHMSRATFARLFTRIAGTTPAAVLLQIRMAQAAVMLNEDKRSTGDIAAAVGYQSEAAFNRVFKRHFDQAPGSYRRQRRGA